MKLCNICGSHGMYHFTNTPGHISFACVYLSTRCFFKKYKHTKKIWATPQSAERVRCCTKCAVFAVLPYLLRSKF